jgi:hypothetical protein
MACFRALRAPQSAYLGRYVEEGYSISVYLVLNLRKIGSYFKISTLLKAKLNA